MRRQIILSLIFICTITTAAVRAQYSPDVATLRTAQELYDERGYEQGKALSVDGHVAVSESNGNLSYVYPISKFSRNGYTIETSLSYCGSVAYTAFDRYVVAHNAPDYQPCTPYEGWQKAHQNRPAWVVGVNGFAVQMLSTASHFTRPPGRRTGEGSRTSFNDSDCVWLADGYDFCNRMVDYGAKYSDEQIGATYVDNIRLMRADGSVLDLVHATERDGTNPDKRPEVYSGYYIPAEANSSAFAVVEFDSVYWTGTLRATVEDAVGDGFRYPLIPRVCRYYPGDGTCFTFREHVAPYGLNAYRSYDSATGGFYGGPTVFYLEEISSAAGPMVSFHRSRHYPLWTETLLEDSSRGRALLLDFDGHSFSYGSNSVTIQAFGRTTTVKFTKVSPSGDAYETTWMPMGRNGYFGYWAFLNSTLAESEAFLHRSYTGYVTEIDDPVGRKTTFTYEPYVRKYIDFGYPHSAGIGGDVTLRLANLRLKSITEPTAKYTVYYYKKTPELGALPSLDAQYLSTSNDTLVIRNIDSQDTMAQKVTNIVAAIDKFDKSNALLKTDRYRFQYLSGTTVTDQAIHDEFDQVTHDTVTTGFAYSRFWLPPIMRGVPTPRYTALTQATTSGGGVTTVEDVYYGAQAGSSGLDDITAWGTTYSAAPSTLGTPFLIPDTARRVTVNGIEKSYQSISYTLDTARTYGGDAVLTGLLGLDLKQKVTRVLDPATHAVLYAQTTDFQHMPYLDTTGTEVIALLRKLLVWARWDSLKSIGAYDPKIKWEEAMYDPRIALWDYDTVSTRVMLPPQYRLPRAVTLRDGTGAILQGTGSWLHTLVDPLWDSSYANRGLPLVDTVIGAGGSARIIAARHGYARRLPSVLVGADGAVNRLSYDHSFPEHPDPAAMGFPWPSGMLFDDRDSVHAYALHSPVYGNFTEQPVAERSYVRRYIPGGGGTVDTLNFEKRYERSFYGLVSGVVDPNGWYAQTEYDADGRLRHLWLPGDFQSPDSVYSIDYSGWDSSDANGTTAYHSFTSWADCRSIKEPPLADSYTAVTTSTLYADDPIIDIPSCPDCGGTIEKNPGRRVQGLCTTPIEYYGTTPAVGSAGFAVMPSEAASILSLDSAYLRLSITSILGECVTLKVTIPALAITKYYLFNCSEDGEGGGGGGSGTGTKEKGSGRRIQSGDTISVSSLTSLKIDLTAKKSEILALQDSSIGVTFEMTTPGGRIEFVSGFDAGDQRPELMLKGSFSKVNHLADYTLAYSYDDGNLASVADAKVDDIRHTANLYDSITVGDCRRVSNTDRFGADWRLLQSERKIVEDSGSVTRVDTSAFAYTGLARRTRLKDPDGDTLATRYDGLGRAVEITNADGTHSAVAYTYGSDTALGVSDQDYYGFAMAKTITNENGTKVTRFTDAFDRLRREVVDSGSTGSSSSHLNLITRYEYDVQGRLTRVVNPKGDTTKYAYDAFGRVQYKRQPDIGTVSYAYDNAGNVRFTQTQDEANGGRMAFTEYDDLSRVTVVGEAVLGGTAYNEDTMLVWTGSLGAFPPSGRLTSTLDPTRLHTSSTTSILTANRTMWSTPSVAVPAFNPAFGFITCVLPANTDLGETSAPVAPFIRRPVSYWFSNPPLASCDTNSFEHIGQHPEFVRIAVAYDTLPASQGSVWQALPAKSQWDQLAPYGVVRNTKGHEVAAAYRERGCEPFHYSVLSYDERGRVEALLRWNENLGFDAVYYTYNSMNQVVCVRAVDPLRQYATWYGYDRAGRIDSVWSSLSGSGGGLATFTGIKYIAPPSRPDTADIVYRYTKTGQLATMQYPPVNVLVTYAYNHRKWLDSLVSTQSGSNLFREILSYDPTGQITKQDWLHGAGTRQEQVYSYDSVQRLTGWTQGPAGSSPTSTTDYSYDNVGNRLDVTDGSTTLEQYTITTGKNQLSSHKSIPSVGFPIRSDYGYNGNGSAVQRMQSEDHGLLLSWQKTENYGYSYRELMRRYKVATPGSLGTTLTTDWRYRYSPGGEREQKRMYPSQWGDTDVVYPWVYYLLGKNHEQLAVYHGQQVVNLYCVPDTGRRVYLYPFEYITNGVGYTGVPEQLGQVITKPSGTKEYRVSDHLASLRVAIEGGTTRTLNYDPWGSAIAGSSSGERSTFNDQEKDIENGLSDLGDRNYNAKTGGFTKPDRLLEKFPSVSSYAYCNDNPLRMTDPNGMQALPNQADEGQMGLFALGRAAVLFNANAAKADAFTRALATGLVRTIHVKGEGNVIIGGVIRTGHNDQSERGFIGHLRAALRDSPLDAFRHAYASALTSRTTGASAVVDLGNAHEAAEADEEKAHAMDRYNNQVGAQIGAAHPNASDSEIESMIWHAMEEGQLQLSPDPAINYHTLKEDGTQK